MSSKTVKKDKSHGRKIKQKRGHRTYNALISTGFKLLEKKDLEKISVAELSREAGYSVGAFYARFHSKDEFFEALVHEHLRNRTETLNLVALPRTLPGIHQALHRPAL